MSSDSRPPWALGLWNEAFVGRNAERQCTNRVLLLFAEMDWQEGKDYSFKTVPWSALSTAEWIEHQPFSGMPYIVDNETGIEVYDSRAICRYIAAKHQSPLLPLISSSDPDSLLTCTRFEEVAASELIQLNQHLLTCILQGLVRPPSSIQEDKEYATRQVRYAQAGVKDNLKAYDRILAKRQWLAGDSMTLIDMFHLPLMAMLHQAGQLPYLDAEPSKEAELQHVARWWRPLTASRGWLRMQEARLVS